MKIVLDTNCLVNIIMPGSYNNDIWQVFRAGKFVLELPAQVERQLLPPQL